MESICLKVKRKIIFGFIEYPVGNNSLYVECVKH